MSAPQTPYAQIQLDSHWRLVAVDDRFEAVTGLDADGVLGQVFEGLISRRDRKGTVELDKQRSSYRGGRIDVVLQLNGPDGDTLVRLRAARCEGQSWTGWLENMLEDGGDVLQRLSAEAEWCRTVVARSDEGIIVLNAEGAITEINQSAMDLLAFRSAEGVLLAHEVVVGAKLFDHYDDERFAPFAEASRKAAKKKKLRFAEHVEHEGRALAIRLSALHLPVRGHVGCALSIRDITVQREIERVSAELESKNEDIRGILSNLDQGILTVEEGGAVHPEYSDRLPSLIGRQEIAGVDVMELLFAAADLGADDLARAETALELVLGESVFGFHLNENCFPRAFSIEVAGERRELEADWAPIESDDGTVHRVMVVLRDVTELNLLRSAAAAQQRELTMIGELLAVPAEAFEDYANACHRGLEQTLAVAHGATHDPVALARSVHTLKGNARAWGLKAICDAIHVLEDELLGDDRDVDELASRTLVAKEVLASYQSLSEETLGRGSNGGSVTSGEQAALRELFELAAERPETLPPNLRALATQASFLPFRPRLDGIASKLRSHAEREGKAAPVFRLPTELFVHRQQLDPLHGAFVHLLTNAVDHGLEDPQTREAAGKPEVGCIELAADEHDGFIHLTLRDDGRGLPLRRLQDKCGFALDSAETAAEAIFNPGVSTAERVTHSSGRGMGMAAVRSEVEDLGGTITVEFEAFDSSAEFAPFRFRITLPWSAARIEDIATATTRAA